MRRGVFFWWLMLASTCVHAQVNFNALPTVANSALDEQNPLLSPDGRSLYFTVSNHPRSAGGKTDKGDIWITQWTDSTWSQPRLLAALNNRNHNAVAGFSADQRVIFLWGHYSKDAILSQGISRVNLLAEASQEPENIAIPYFLNRSEYSSGVITGEESILVYSAEGFGTLGADDLYVSFKKPDGFWSEPRNLGPQINTRLQDVSPTLSSDGRRLYFSTNGRQGRGSFDIYYADRLDDTWTNWSKPVNLGPDVNTPGRELFYHLYPQWGIALYTSTQNSDGYGDVRVHKLSQGDSARAALPPVRREPVSPVVIVPAPVADEVPSDNRIEVFGRLLNSKDQAPVAGRIYFQSDSLLQQEVKSGNYQLPLRTAREYVITVEAEGFVGKTERLDLRTYQLRRVELNFALQPAEVGVTVNLKNVLFQQSTADLLPDSYAELDAVYNMMKVNPKMEIFLSGHTDNRGLHYLNVRLSQSRVEAVKAYLVKKGIAATRISGQGFGGIRPIADNDAEDTRKLNRRVEFTITKTN